MKVNTYFHYNVRKTAVGEYSLAGFWSLSDWPSTYNCWDHYGIFPSLEAAIAEAKRISTNKVGAVITEGVLGNHES